jgi:SAM-dependent methyltransferase
LTFHDYFSHSSAAYRDARPTYPRAVFAWLASASPSCKRAWDCGCGTGQASVLLADHFELVLATDASQSQLDAATPHPNVRYSRALAEESGHEPESLDVCTVAQAAHWFDHDKFAREVRRVLKPHGLLAYLTYGIHHVSPEVDAVLGRYYTEIVGPYWPTERIHVDEHYRNIPFPFQRMAAPDFEIEHLWDAAQLMAYLDTWSATMEYRNKMGSDPREIVWSDFHQAWGDPAEVRRVTWPLTVVAGYRD